MKKIFIPFFILMFLMTTAFSCRKAIKPRIAKKKPKLSLAKKLRKGATGFAVGAGAYIVTEDLLREAFEQAGESGAIHATIKNKTHQKQDVQVTSNGKDWKATSLYPNEDIVLPSQNKGIIGLKYEDKFIKIEESNTFFIQNNGGQINFESH